VPTNLANDQLPTQTIPEVLDLLQVFPDLPLLHFVDGEYLLHAGEESDHIFLLLEGTCAVEYPFPQVPFAASRAPMAILEASPDKPLFVGEMAYLGKQPRSASVKSAMASVVLQMEPPHLDYILAHMPVLTRLLCYQFVERLRETSAVLSTCVQTLHMEVEPVAIPAGTVLVQAEETTPYLYILLEGCVHGISADGTVQEFCSTPDGRPLNPYEYFAETAASLTLRTESPCMLLKIPPRSREAAVRNFPKLVLSLLRERT
jgi:CRP-like cAMP-binding protein